MTVCEFGQKPGWPWGFCGYDCPPCTPAADSGHPAAVILVRAHGPAHPLGWGVYFLCFFSLLVRELQWVSISALGDNFFFFSLPPTNFFPCRDVGHKDLSRLSEWPVPSFSRQTMGSFSERSQVFFVSSWWGLRKKILREGMTLSTFAAPRGSHLCGNPHPSSIV